MEEFGFFEIFARVLASFYAVVPSLGLGIILLTVAVRLVILPLSIKQTRSMREMQRLQPEVKRIQAKYKGDRQKMNEEMMALYKEHNVSPFGGCLPLLLQMPVFIGLFYVIRSPLNYLDAASRLATDLEERALEVHRFLGLRLDCSPTWVYGDVESSGVSCGQGLLSLLPYAFLIALLGLTTYYQQRQMQVHRGPNADPQMQQMQLVGKIMPLVLMLFSWTFPTGVILYWLTTNLWTIGQQRIMFRVAPPVTGPAATKQADRREGKGAPGGGKASAGGGKSPAGGTKATGAGGKSPGGKSSPGRKPAAGNGRAGDAKAASPGKKKKKR